MPAPVMKVMNAKVPIALARLMMILVISVDVFEASRNLPLLQRLPDCLQVRRLDSFQGGAKLMGVH